MRGEKGFGGGDWQCLRRRAGKIEMKTGAATLLTFADEAEEKSNRGLRFSTKFGPTGDR